MPHYFQIQSRLTEFFPEDPCQADIPVVAVMTTAEAAQNPLLKKLPELPLKRGESIRFCKAESHPDYLSGTFFIPPTGSRTKAVSFQYAIFKNRLLLIDDNQLVLNLIQRLQGNVMGKGLGHFMAELMELLTSKDLQFLIKIEDQFVKLEDEVLSGVFENFNHKITRLRRQVLVYSHYCLQLSDMCGVFQQNDHGFFSDRELNEFRLFSERAMRLHGEAAMLREYSTQIREVYQAQIDLKQNKTMKILTVVTTVFMPLTLFAGWYGMNFDMPELHWKYGYPVFALASLALVSASLALCRKKHFL